MLTGRSTRLPPSISWSHRSRSATSRVIPIQPSCGPSSDCGRVTTWCVISRRIYWRRWRRVRDPRTYGRRVSVLYLATLPEAVYVLHVFRKQRQRTPQLDLNVARTRLKELLRERREG